MNNFKEIALLLGLVAFILTVRQVRGDAASDLQKAFDNTLTSEEQNAFTTLMGPSFFDGLKEIANCVAEELKPISLCNFHTSIDPFYYINKCAKDTPIEALINKTFGQIGQLEVPFAFPLVVPKERCFSIIPKPTVPSLPMTMAPTLPPIKPGL